jgi:histidinol dehydrogenase
MPSELSITRLSTAQADFEQQLKHYLAWDESANQEVVDTVKAILEEVRTKGDEALLTYTKRFDRLDLSHPQDLELSKERLALALTRITEEQKSALEFSAKRIRDYHDHQAQSSWEYADEQGNILGQKIVPLDRVGVYVPGGKAAYPSSVLMNVIPAKVAGVKEVIMVVPTPDGVLNELVLAAAAIAGVDRIFTIGGAQAVAALAYGTETVPGVDKIVGPGNIYVATAKKEVFGTVGIDMIAGPSEILVICDGKTDPDWIAMDLFSQAEHDENAQPILVCPDRAYLDRVEQSMLKLLPSESRSSIIALSLADRALFIEVDDLAEAVIVSNRVAPEHLELSVDDPRALLAGIRHAGAIFMGRYTAEALGDYCAGPNHVLPTSGTARFSSPLGVYDFQKRSSILSFTEQGASDIGKVASILARGEGLTAHARSAEYRILPD